jgi:hypothetical protein
LNVDPAISSTSFQTFSERGAALRLSHSIV